MGNSLVPPPPLDYELHFLPEKLSFEKILSKGSTLSS